jgi:cobalamin biosynthetic protein CobC
VRDHGGGIDAARARWGGERADWLDLSTGINPVPWGGASPGAGVAPEAWAALPDRGAQEAFVAAARRAWRVPDGAAALPLPGASAAIALLPRLVPPGRACVPGPTYNEHAAGFRAAGWSVGEAGAADAFVAVHPNNPDGRLWRAKDLPPARLTILDESFCDLLPDASLIALAARPGVVVLKSFGKFWGLAGLRLGLAAGDPAHLAALAEAVGPWPVSGPALAIGTAALADPAWAGEARARLARDAARLGAALAPHAEPAGGTDLFRLVRLPEAGALADRLARHRILVRRFPWSAEHLRVGLPGPRGWARLEAALS